MLPFEDRLCDNEINNAEAGEEARMISESDNIAVSSNAKHKYELADVDATETDDGLLSYDQASDKWTTTTTIDGGTF